MNYTATAPTRPHIVRIRALGSSVRKLGDWTAADSFEVHARRGAVILELRGPSLPAEVEIEVDLDHSMLKLLVPEGAVVEQEEVRQLGRCGFVDWGGTLPTGGPVIRVRGQMRSSELRINRGGIAIVSAMLTGEYLRDLERAFTEIQPRSLKDIQDAYREGRWTTVEDPGRRS